VSTKRATKGKSSARPGRGTSGGQPHPRFGSGARIAGAIALAIVVLGAIYLANRPTGTGPGKYAFQVGSPGPGQAAPEFSLPSTTGGMFDLSSARGKSVLLYFQEGLTCQPCWDQLSAIQQNESKLEALGIDQVVSITTDSLDQLRQKATDEGLTTPVLSDRELSVSSEYQANSYGMMGNSRDGHTFILVGPDGTIRWRADYGGAPDYTMFVPVDDLAADITAGAQGAT
jgi:peroxiredoxin